MQLPEFCMKQYYRVTIDESSIDDEERLLRLLRAIVADQKALATILPYLVILEHGMRTEGSEDEMLTDHYGKAPSFLDILAQIAHCFTKEDRQWIVEIAKNFEKDTEWEKEGRWNYFHELQECFKVVPSGWDIMKVHTQHDA